MRSRLAALILGLLWTAPWVFGQETATLETAEQTTAVLDTVDQAAPSIDNAADEALSHQATALAPLREAHTTADFSRVKERVDELIAKYSSADVLLVVDIDNTLLSMNQDLGSDQWFTWQYGLLGTGSPDLVADNLEGLLEVQSTLFSLSKMHPPEPDLPRLMEQIMSQGVTTVVLTSRGYSFRDASERELERNGYKFLSNDLDINEVRGVFYPYDEARPDDHGLSKEVMETLGPPKLVTYSNGIYMTAGQHKGYMLKTLLARAHGEDFEPKKFKAIVFVDDHLRHTVRMHEAFEGEEVDLITFRYSREDGIVKNFNDSSKRHVVEDWEILKGFIEAVLVK